MQGAYGGFIPIINYAGYEGSGEIIFQPLLTEAGLELLTEAGLDILTEESI